METTYFHFISIIKASFATSSSSVAAAAAAAAVTGLYTFSVIAATLQPRTEPRRTIRRLCVCGKGTAIRVRAAVQG